MTGASIEKTLELWAISLRDEGADVRFVHAGTCCGVRRVVLGRAARRQTVQDWLDACGSGRRSGTVAAAGDPWPRSVGC
jgi:hypothetical protein